MIPTTDMGTSGGTVQLDLRKIFEGYVKNYQTLLISSTHTCSTYTLKELDYFSRLGSMLGYETFTEDTVEGKSRAMDLSWWNDYDPEKETWNKLVLHLERENFYAKDEKTLDKLSSEIDTDWRPEYRIAIIHVRNPERITILQKIAQQKFKSDRVMIIYRVDYEINDEYEVRAFIMDQPDNPICAGCKTIPESDVLYMYLK